MIRQIPDDDDRMHPLLTPSERSERSEEPLDEPEQIGNLWNLLNDRLSGHWPHAITLGIILALALAVLGYRIPSVKYDAQGIIRVSPRVMPLIHEMPETGLTPMYNNYVQTQARFVTGPRVLDQSLRHIDLDETPWESVPDAMKALQANLFVNSERDTELIYVAFRAEDPKLAQYVANAVLRAYDEIYGSAEGDEHGRRLQRLRSERAAINEELRRKRDELRTLVASTGYGVSDFQPLIDGRVLDIETAVSEMQRLQYVLESIRARGSARDAEAPDKEGEAILNERELEAFDAKLADLGEQRYLARMEFARAVEKWTPRNWAYVQAERRLKVLTELYNDRAAIVREELLASGQRPTTSDPAELERNIEYLKGRIEEQRAVVRQMTARQSSIDNLATDSQRLEVRLAEVDDRIHGLDMEAETIRSGRIHIAAYADRPLRPAQDRRRPLAAAGAIGGLGMGIGAFFLIGSLDRRVYFARQLGGNGGSSTSQLLGVLPALPQRAGDVESSSVAAHCVHQIRNHIETARGSSKPAVLAISSPYQGDGKTSLAMALGASYATTGCRVLLVDCDLIGKNLTTHTMMSGQAGLREVLRTGNAHDYVVDLPIENASVLPVGNDPGYGPEMIRREQLESLFNQVRRSYDLILVDTGPLFGSIESLPVAAAADGVILTMQRGRRHARLMECLRELRSAGANYLGFVLNYARVSDCDRYVSKSRISAVVSAHEMGTGTNGFSHAKPPRPRTSRNALLRAMQVTSRLDT